MKWSKCRQFWSPWLGYRTNSYIPGGRYKSNLQKPTVEWKVSLRPGKQALTNMENICSITVCQKKSIIGYNPVLTEHSWHFRKTAFRCILIISKIHLYKHTFFIREQRHSHPWTHSNWSYTRWRMFGQILESKDWK